MFKAISNTIPADPDFSQRVYQHEIRKRLLDGTFYDNMFFEFQDERQTENGGNYVPLRRRAPSVRVPLCKTVVEDVVSLTFGEGRFPTVDSPDTATREALEDVIKNCRLQQVMVQAAITGSIGSVLVMMRVLKNSDGENRIYFSDIPTQFLTPVYDLNAPDTLLKVTERYKIKGSVLADIGYDIPPDNLRMDYWWQRVFDQNSEIYFQPMLYNESKDPKTGKWKPMIEDADRQVKHNLGFVPCVWIKNLPVAGATVGTIDGACTFEAAIHTQIEIEYLLSQSGRALKFQGDPLLVIMQDGDVANLRREASKALHLPENADAKFLELDGGASDAVINHVRTLRELALEGIHGNRSSIDKLSLPQSGSALKVLYFPLISLADCLRGTYGEEGLKTLLKMVLRAQAKLGNLQAGDVLLPRLDPKSPISLRWPDYFPPTAEDKRAESQALAENVGAGNMSRETAVKTLAHSYDIEDVSAEIALIEADEAKRQAETIAAAAATAKQNLVPQDAPKEAPTK